MVEIRTGCTDSGDSPGTLVNSKDSGKTEGSKTVSEEFARVVGIHNIIIIIYLRQSLQCMLSTCTHNVILIL